MPGIGAYTAAAVASMAFAVVEPTLDGNVERVMSRLLGEPGDPKRAAIRRRLKEHAHRFLDPQRPGDSNQALMELGATLCRRRHPQCTECPLQTDCRAFREGQPEIYPRPAARRKRVQERWCIARVERHDRLLLFRRPESSRVLPGIWELPCVEAGRAERVEMALACRYGGEWKLQTYATRYRHAITYRDIEVEVWNADLRDSSLVAEGREAQWLSRSELDKLPLSALVHKALDSY